MSVLERAQGLERYLDDPRFPHDPGDLLRQHLQLMDTKLTWTKDFVDTRLKLLQFVNIDTWLHELLGMIEDVDRDLGRALEAQGVDLSRVTLGLRERLQERIRAKLLGRPTLPAATESFEGEVRP